MEGEAVGERPPFLFWAPPPIPQSALEGPSTALPPVLLLLLRVVALRGIPPRSTPRVPGPVLPASVASPGVLLSPVPIPQGLGPQSLELPSG